MGDPAPGEARNQAVPHPVVDEPNEDDVHPDSLHNNKPSCLPAYGPTDRCGEYPIQPPEKIQFSTRRVAPLD